MVRNAKGRNDCWRENKTHNIFDLDLAKASNRCSKTSRSLEGDDRVALLVA